MATELPEEPKSRKEQYLADIAGQDVELPAEPKSREEQYLAYIAENGGGGGGSGTSNFNQLSNRPKYNGTTMTGNTNIPEVKTYTAGDNITISGNQISATDTTYTAGTGLSLNGTEFSADTSVLATQTDLSGKQNTLTAGSNITISGDTISATDTTYSNFVGTDGTAAGSAGLVPAPATTDAGKFLKADGTWDTAGGGSGPTVVQTTGTSQTDVMSQNAVTSMVFADPSTKQQVRIGDGTYSTPGSNSIEIGSGSMAKGLYAVAIGSDTSVESFASYGVGIGASATVIGDAALSIGYSSSASGGKSVALGRGATANKPFSVALGAGASPSANGEINVSTGSIYTTSGYNSSNYRLLTGLYDPQSAHDAATKGYVDPTTDSSAPTTATVGRLGQIQIDTTNADAYMCVAVDSVTPSYTWKKINV